MTKVYPKAASPPQLGVDDPVPVAVAERVLTVWKKSLLFNCDGFTVFDAHGNLLYRVDNYLSRNNAEIVLMDAFGNSLLTIRRKKLSLGDSWLVFDGETVDNPELLVKKNVNILNKKCLAHVEGRSFSYQIEGSYEQRCCAVYDGKRRLMAEIKQKESTIKGVHFGTDIFRLIVQPGFDPALAMALLILLDQMFGSSPSRRRRLLTNHY